jgi:membrane protease YdiL (CAAX protease family)
LSATLWDHVLAVLFGLVVPGLGAFRHLRNHKDPAADRADSEESWDSSQKIAMYWSNAAFLTLASGAVLWAWRGAGRSLADLGFRAPERAAEGTLLALGALVLYALNVRAELAPSRRERNLQQWRSQTPFMPVARREQAHSLAMVVSSAICEEIIYRGFLIQYVRMYTGTSAAGGALAIALPALVFAASHFYQGVSAVMKIVVLAAIFGAVFAITSSLWIPMALHFVLDFCGILLSRKLLSSPREPSELPQETRL